MAAITTGYEEKLKRSGGEDYKGRPIFAPPGLHEHLEALAARWFPPGARLLDLGAGSGALALRLSDCGFRVECADAMPSDFLQTLGLRTHRIDFNQRFAGELDGPFDGIVSSEVIEHLENSRQFLREVRASLAPGGRAILTTPNIGSVTSKARFVRYGSFDWFTPPDREALGHISPIAPGLLADAALAAGLCVKRIEGFGPIDWGVGNWPSQRLLLALLRLVSRGSGDPPECTLVAILERPVHLN